MLWGWFWLEGRKKSLCLLMSTKITNCFWKWIPSLYILDILKMYTEFCMSNIARICMHGTGYLCPWKMQKPFRSPNGGATQPHGSSWESRDRPAKQGLSINGNAELLLVATKSFETSEQRFMSYNKSQVVLSGGFETLLHQIHPITAQAPR